MITDMFSIFVKSYNELDFLKFHFGKVVSLSNLSSHVHTFLDSFSYLPKSVIFEYD